MSRTPRAAWGRRALLVGGLLALIGWQTFMFRLPWPEAYDFHPSSGLAEQDKFVYFLYYTNTFPVASTNNGLNYEFFYTKSPVDARPNTLEYSPAGARRALHDEGASLVMEWGHTLRSGQLLSAYLFLPDAWRLGSPRFAEVRVANGASFIAALVSVYLMSWWVGMPLFGALFVLLIGSNSFQLYEAYRHENVFSWPITAFCFVLAVALPFLTGRRLSTWYAMGAAIAAGVFVATVRQIRPEPFVLVGAMTMAVAWASSLTWRTRLMTIALLVGTTVASTHAWGAYFDAKVEDATRAVKSAGGHVLDEPLGHYHNFWHPIWCGLGDFGSSRGYAWDDSKAIVYAQPILKARYEQELPWWWGVKGKDDGERTAEDFLDRDRLYYRLPYLEPHYEDVLREKVVGDIVHEPFWYAGILGRRLWRIFSETTRPQIATSTSLAMPLPLSAMWFVTPIAIAAAFLRRWTTLKILAFSFATSIPVLLVYSGRGMTDYSVFHLCALALVPSLALPEDRRVRTS